MTILVTLGIIAHMLIGGVIAFLFMRYHARIAKVDGNMVAACFIMNITFWPLVAPFAVYNYCGFKPLKAMANYFNRKYGVI